MRAVVATPCVRRARTRALALEAGPLPFSPPNPRPRLALPQEPSRRRPCTPDRPVLARSLSLSPPEEAHSHRRRQVPSLSTTEGKRRREEEREERKNGPPMPKPAQSASRPASRYTSQPETSRAGPLSRGPSRLTKPDRRPSRVVGPLSRLAILFEPSTASAFLFLFLLTRPNMRDPLVSDMRR